LHESGFDLGAYLLGVADLCSFKVLKNKEGQIIKAGSAATSWNAFWREPTSAAMRFS